MSGIDGGSYSGDESGRIREAVISFAASAGAVDLGTVYRYVSPLVGGVSPLAIASVLSALVREKVLQVDVRWYGDKGQGPCVGIVSLRNPGSPARVDLGVAA